MRTNHREETRLEKKYPKNMKENHREVKDSKENISYNNKKNN